MTASYLCCLLQMEERKREKAREANRAKPLWEEDGKRRGLLDKWVGGRSCFPPILILPGLPPHSAVF
jgi:hypothetical protein